MLPLALLCFWHHSQPASLFSLLPGMIMQGVYLSSDCSWLDQQLEMQSPSIPSPPADAGTQD